MKSAQKRFADLRAILEDLHGLAVEGVHPDLTQEDAIALCASLIAGLKRGKRRAEAISRQQRTSAR